MKKLLILFVFFASFLACKKENENPNPALEVYIVGNEEVNNGSYAVKYWKNGIATTITDASRYICK